MRDRSVIVIGAGLAGLAAGTYARMNGYPCLILEQHSAAGGAAASWRRKEFLVDGGVHFLMGYRPGTEEGPLFKDLGLDLKDSVVPMTVYGRFIDENKGRRIDVSQDLDRLARDLKAYSDEDSRLIDAFVNGARDFRSVDLWKAWPPLKSFRGRFGRSVDEFGKLVRDAWLREFLKQLFLPEAPVWFIQMILGLLADGRLGYLRGGCRDLVHGLEKRYRDLGGEIDFQAHVKEILVEDGRAAGIRLADGQRLAAGAVISAADGYETLFGMLGGRFLDRKTRKRFQSWKLSSAIVTVSFGVRREFPQDVPLSILSLMHPFAVDSRKIDRLLVRIFNYSPHFAPPGKSVIQIEFNSEFEFWGRLQRNSRTEYDAQKQRVASEVLKRLEKHFPGLSSEVEMTDVATPFTFWRCTRNLKAATMAWMPTPEFFRSSLPRTLPGLRRFYLAGQWVAGGGVLPSLNSGRQAVQLLCRDDERTGYSD